jgi:membrane-associated phospholipid phosphatase
VLAAARRLRADLAPVDRVHVGFYVFVLLWCVARFNALPNPAGSIGWFLGALVASVALSRVLRGRGGSRSTTVRTLFTIAVAPVSYLMLGDIVPHVNPWHGEALLKAIDDELFFGNNPNVLLDRLAWPPLTEVLQLNYSLYYGIPILLFVVFLFRRNSDAIGRSLFLALLCLYASYVGYFFVPATGPNINCRGLYPAHFTDSMPGLWMAERIRAALLSAEAIKHDCWPSGHTALSWTCLMIARREHSRTAFWLLVPPVFGLIFATMYLRYHYVIDVVFGFVLAWAVMRFGPRIYARLRRDDLDAPALPPPQA